MALHIAVFAALPQETAPILRQDAAWRRVAGKPFPINVHRSPGGETLLVETGIGTQRAAQAARYIAEGLLSATPPDLMISLGFAGALSSRLILGQTVWAKELAVLDASAETCVVRYRCGGGAGGPSNTPDFFAEHAVEPVRFLTVERLRPKTELARLVPESSAVTEMETTSIAEVAHAHATPFVGLRAISDELDLEIDLDLDSIVDRHGRVRLYKLLPTVLARPRCVRSLPALRRGSKLAGRNLARTLAALLALPEEDLRALAGPPRPVEE